MPAKAQLKLYRHMLHPLAILALVGLSVTVLWSVLLIEQARNHRDVERHAKAEAANVARAFEEHVARTFNNIEAALLVLRQSWLDDRERFESKVRIMQAAYDKALLVQIAIIDANGKLAYSNLDPDAKPVDLSDREHFRVHRDSEADDLFISKPVKGRVSGRYSIQLTRPIRLEGGRFGGVLVISLSPDYFSQFFGSIDLGEGGSISLTGTDGVMRARGVDMQLDVEAIGTVLPDDRPFLRRDAPIADTYETISAVDGVKRFISYRRINGYPMVVAVTSAVEAVFAEHMQLWFRYKLGTMAVSLLMLIGGAWLARSLQLQYRLKTRLLFANGSLRTLNNIATQPEGGLATRLRKALDLGCRHLGVEFGIVSHIYGDRYHVESCCAPPDSSLKDGTVFELAQSCCSITLNSNDVVAIQQMSQSEYAGHPCFEAFRLECYIGVPIWVNGTIYGTLNFSSAKPYERQFDDCDLEFIRLLGRWMGMVIADDRSITELRTLATTDALTGTKSRGYFTNAIDQEISWARRHDQPLSMVLIDLDHFKKVNDCFGHHAGDETLRRVAKLCQGTLRTSDLFARLGGEEFAALLRNTTESEAAVVCERMRDIIAADAIETLGGPVRITISAGVAELTDDEDFKAIYNRVDAALYEAKHQGRNRVVTSGAGM